MSKFNKFVKYIDTIFENPKVKYPHPENLSHSTPFKMGNRLTIWMINKYLDYFDNPNRIIDLTGSIGGDSLTFSKFFPNVTTFEIDSDKYKSLLYNINLYDKQFQISAFNRDSSLWLKNEHNHKNTKNKIVYFDPPWGGLDYKHQDVISDLYLCDLGVINIIDLCLHYGYPMITVKLPFNFDWNKFDKYKTSFTKKEKKTYFITIINDLIV